MKKRTKDSGDSEFTMNIVDKKQMCFLTKLDITPKNSIVLLSGYGARLRKNSMA